MNTQNQRLIEYLKLNKSITQLEALTELGIFRLASRINDLKNMGYTISGEMTEVTNRFGEKVRVKRYFLTKNT